MVLNLIQNCPGDPPVQILLYLIIVLVINPSVAVPELPMGSTQAFQSFPRPLVFNFGSVLTLPHCRAPQMSRITRRAPRGAGLGCKAGQKCEFLGSRGYRVQGAALPMRWDRENVAQWKRGALGQKCLKAATRRAGLRGDRFMQALAERWRALPGGSARADTSQPFVLIQGQAGGDDSAVLGVLIKIAWFPARRIRLGLDVLRSSAPKHAPSPVFPMAGATVE